VVVSTDDADICRLALAAGADVVIRPANISTGTASSEAALLHTLQALEAPMADVIRLAAGEHPGETQLVPFTPDVLVFMQATSPFIAPEGIAQAVRRVAAGQADVVFSARESHGFQWRLLAGELQPIGHEIGRRAMRQELAPQFLETGAFYVMDAAGFRKQQHRFFGRIAVQEVPAETGWEIDSLSDFALCEAIAPLVDPMVGVDVGAAIGPVAAVVTDFDGVHTDNRAWISADGAECVAVNRSDGWGVARLLAAGIPMLILSSEVNPVVKARAAKLGVEVLHSVSDKASTLNNWLNAQGLSAAQVAYLGNDVNDLGAMKLVGWPCAVADSYPEVKAAARVVLNARGGAGAVRELCDRVLKAMRPESSTFADK
jgi:N-acylneuraminate cytidylyltransferase